MEHARKLVLVLGLGLLVSLLGCGGGSDDQSTTTEEPLYPWLKGPSREFLIRDYDNAVQIFGHEASKAEREQASRVIEAFMRARAARDFKKECTYFSRRYIKALVKEDALIVSKGKAKTCPQALAYFGSAASGDFKNTMNGPISSLRVRNSEERGYAQYHGLNGRDWIVPVDRENGRWWVSLAAPIDRLK